MRSVALFAVAGAAASVTPSLKDLARARTKKPLNKYRGHGVEEMATVLNGHMKKQFANTQECEEWSLDELHQFQEKVWEARSPALEEIYKGHDNRQLFGAGVETVEELRAVFAATKELVRGNATLDRIARDGHCHEAVMWLIHHVPEEKQASLVEGASAPLLPETVSEEKKACADATGKHAEVCTTAKNQDTCSWCHNKQSDPPVIPDAKDPSWVGPDDLNPHKWDRNRRCDQDYKNGTAAKGGFKDGTCGPCEGIGGIAWDDENDKITIPDCTVVALPHEVDMSTVGLPLFPKQYTVPFWEVLIGIKTDPFCFAFFPGADSRGTLCYRKEMGINYYDIEKESATFVYDKVKLPKAPFSYGPNISSNVYHIQDRMWIVNTLYAGVKQCICTDPGKDVPTKCYPTRYDFAANAVYLGRIKFNVEFLWEDMELDHWHLWAHHVFISPVTKQIVRMWKPWNGLQVYPIGGWKDSVAEEDAEKWFTVPPPECKKGGAHIRITCDDDGNYKPKAPVEGQEHLDEFMRYMETFAPPQQIVV